MSLDFNGSSDGLSASQSIGDKWAISAWFNPRSGGSGLGGSIFGYVYFAGLMFNMYSLDFRIWVGPGGIFDVATGFPAYAGWKWVLMTFDASTVGNTPTVYLWSPDVGYQTKTVGSGITVAQALQLPINVTEPVVYGIGNNASGYAFDGQLAEVALWKRVLTAAEAAAVFTLGVNAVPDHYNYMPLDGGRLQNFGSSGSVFTPTGTVVAENPPARPAGRRG